MTAWFLYALAFAALCTPAALAAEALLRMYRRPTRGVWAAAILLSIAGPLAMTARPAPTAASAIVFGAPMLDAAATPTDAPRPTLAARIEPLLPVLWAGASLLLLAGIAVGAAALGRRRRAWRSARLAGAPVLVSDDVGPAVVGFIRPAIVVPRWTLDWTEPMQRLVVTHEGEHIRARDPLLVLAATAAAALVPWNPAVWWQLRRLRLAVEVDCDARTLRTGADVATYGDLLLRVGARGSGLILPAAAFAEPRSFLERRIRAMTTRTPRNRAARAAALAGLTLGLAAAGYALPAPARPEILSRLVADGSPVRATADTVPVLGISEVDVKPRAINGAEIVRAMEHAYPTAMRVAGRGGTVMVDMVVREDGSAAVTPPSDDPSGFHVAAYTVARQMRFTPGREAGKPVAVRLSIPLTFSPNAARISIETSTTVKVDTVVMVDTVLVPATTGPETIVFSSRALMDQIAETHRELARLELAREHDRTPAHPRLLNSAEVARALEAAYPRHLRDAGTRGTVQLDLTIRADGTAGDVRVVRASNPSFSEAALKVATRMRFAPAHRDGRPVTTRVPFTLSFQPRRAAL